MSELTDLIKSFDKPEDFKLTEEEYWAVYEWVNANKDDLPGPLKSGMLKLINGEEHRNL